MAPLPPTIKYSTIKYTPIKKERSDISHFMNLSVYDGDRFTHNYCVSTMQLWDTQVCLANKGKINVAKI